MIKYYELGPDKRLNEIVMAGSHDAGITGGGANIQTQSVDIHGQATAGVRIFDLRIAAATVAGTTGGVKNAELKSFHADAKLQSKAQTTRHMAGLGGAQQIVRTKLRGGAFGLGLSAMLQQARLFVQQNSSEFLILKFDKSTNWMLIAESCVNELGTEIYTGGGNLNRKRLRDLQGKVIVLFTEGGIAEVHNTYGPLQGILGIRNLYGGTSAYSDNFNGLQYFGKGGTSPFNPYRKINQNVKKQSKIIGKGGDGNPNVMGMMYWTTTGLTGSIQARNDGMWDQPKVAKLRNMWDQGLDNAITSRVNKYTNINGFAGGQVLKAFMPNMIMIDFADSPKCQEIFELNTIPVTFLVDALGNYAHV
jgi:hypothetical protein